MSHQNESRYMFFSNLETIIRCSNMLLEMNPEQLDRILNEGHDWASDHIATSKDDIEEVANFFINMMGETEEESAEETFVQTFESYQRSKK
jgi:hypothetical protein